MSTTTPSPKTVPVLERLARLESALQDLYNATSSMMEQFRSQIMVTSKSLEGMLVVLNELHSDFTPKVDAAIKVKSLERDTKKAEREKAELDLALSKGAVKVTDKISSPCLVVGRLFDQEGNLVMAGREQTMYPDQFAEEVRTAMNGQGVGYMYEAPNKTKFEVLEIYEFVEETPKKVETVTTVEPSAVSVPVSTTTVPVETV